MIEHTNIETVKDVLILSRFFYKWGQEELALSDREYDEYWEHLREVEPSHWLITQSWSDDKTPYDLISKYGIDVSFMEVRKYDVPEEIVKSYTSHLQEITDYFSDRPSKSIDIIRTDEQLNKFLGKVQGQRLNMSIKIDGWNFEAVYVEGDFVNAQTRNRDGGEGIDITSIMYRILPKKINKSGIVKINGEIALGEKHLSYLRSKYNKPFKMARASVSSFIRGLVREEDLCLLDVLMFNVKSDEFITLSEKLLWLQSQGFTVVPYESFTFKDIQDIRVITERFEGYAKNANYPSDGVVLSVENVETFYNLHSGNPNFYGGNCAIKMGLWDSGVYQGYLRGVLWTIGKQTISPVGIIEPTKVDIGATVRRVPLQNLRYMTENGLAPNCQVKFEYVGDSRIHFLGVEYGEGGNKLKRSIELDRLNRSMELYNQSQGIETETKEVKRVDGSGNTAEDVFGQLLYQFEWSDLIVKKSEDYKEGFDIYYDIT